MIVKRASMATAFAAATLCSTSATALNGLRPIAPSAVSRAMGGTGLALYSSSFDAVYKNPALLTKQATDSGVSDLTLGMAIGDFRTRAKGNSGRYKSDWVYPNGDTTGVFPSGFGLGYKASNDINLGFGFYGGGGGADYSGQDPVLGAKSNVIAFSGVAGAGFPITPQLSVGLSLWATTVSVEATSENFSGKGPRNETGGKAAVYGLSAGASYKASSTLTLGAYIQPPQTAVIKDGRDYFMEERRAPGDRDNVLFTASPFEAALGLAYQASPKILTSVDARFLRWSEAQFLKELGWEDQAVIAMGLAYNLDQDNLIRVGYNYGNRPAPDVKMEEGQDLIAFQGHPLPKLAASAISSIAAFGLTQHHYTLGSSHKINSNLLLDTSVTHMAKESITRNGTSFRRSGPPDLYGWTGEFQATIVQLEMRLTF